MIANTQANPLSSLLAAVSPAATSVMGSASGTQQARFDLTLLEMTKHVVDSTVTAAEQKAVPEKVGKALETVLSQLSKLPAETQALLGKTHEARQFQQLLVDQTAQAGNLTTLEHEQLEELVSMVVNRVQSGSQQPIAFKASESEIEKAPLAPSVMHSGPFGGTTEPIQPLTSDTEHSNTEIEIDPARELPQLAANIPAPMIVSVRTQVTADAKAEAATPLSGVETSAPVQSSSSVQPQNNAVVLSTQAPKAAEAASQPQTMTMNTSQQPVAQPQLSQESQAVPQAASPTISPETPKTEISNQSAVAVAAPQVQQQPSVSKPESSPELTVKSSAQRQPQAQTPAAEPQAKTVPQQNLPQFEILASNAGLPQIVAGSEISVSDVESAVLQKPVTKESQPVIQAPAAQLTPVVQPSVAPAQQNEIQPAAAAAVVPVKASVIPASDDSAPATALSVESRDDAKPVTPMQRFLDDAALKASRRESTEAIQAPVVLSRENFKDLAKTISTEYALRENVFAQAVKAIEDASQSASQIRIQLKPESLGHLEVALSIEGGKLTAKLIASSNEVRDVFAASLPQFKQALEAQGLQVSALSVAVRAETGNQGQAQPQWQQPQWQPSIAEESTQMPATWNAFNAPVLAGSSSTFNALA